MDLDFFKLAEDSLKNWVQSKSQVFSPQSEEVLIEEGKDCEEIYILRRGELTVTTSSKGGEEVLLANLREGSIVGEMSFLESRPPVATVKVSSGSEVLAINKKLLFKAIDEDFVLGRALFHFLAQKLSQQIQDQNTLIHTFSGSIVEPLRKVFTLFSDLEESDVNWISKNSVLYRLQPDQILIRQGELIPEIFLILAGDVNVSVQIEEKEKIVGSSNRGELLGEMSMLSSDYNLTTATVRALSGVEVIGVDKKTLQENIQSNSGFGMRFYRGMARMLSQRGRDQLASMGLASISTKKELSEDNYTNDVIDFEMLSGITTAGTRFDWLCKEFQNKTANNHR